MAYSYDQTKLTNLKQLKKLAVRTKTEIEAVKTSLADALMYATYSGNKLSFFRNNAGTGTAAFAFDLPEEMFLDQAHTEFVGDFAWSSSDYPGSTNPNLDGKPVMVLAVKGDATNPTYSFIDMTSLVDTYSGADASIVVSGYTIGVQIDSTAGNALTLVSGKGLRVDISGKADKVSNATSGNFAGLDGNGNLTDSGKKAADFAAATHTHDDKADKVSSATSGNFAGLDANGNLTDSGSKAADFAAANHTHDDKADKPSSATTGNLAKFDANKNPIDSGIAAGNVMQKVASATANDFALLNASGEVTDAGFGLATDTEVDDMIHDVWGDPET